MKRFAVLAAALAAFTLACSPARAEQAPDPWQSYLQAAAAAAAEDDDGAAALALEAALALAAAEDPKGARSRIAYAELTFLYNLLNDTNRANGSLQAFNQTRELTPDERLLDFETTAKSLGDAFRKRWANSAGGDRTQTGWLATAADFNFAVRVRILRALRPGESDVLAQALLDKGHADFDAKFFDAAIKALEESIALGDASQARRETLRTASRVLSPAATGSKTMPSDLDNDVGGAVAFAARDYLAQTYVAQGWKLEFSSPSAAAAAFRSAVATERYLVERFSDQLVGGERDALLSTSVAGAWRGLCRIAARNHEGRDECKTQGTAAYQRALALDGERHGEISPDALYVARDFAKFLREIDDDQGAIEIERRYRVTYVDETVDFGVAPQPELRAADQLSGPTPTSLPGGEVVSTRDLIAATRSNRLRGRSFALLRVTPDEKGLTIFDAARFWAEGDAASFDDQAQARLKDVLTSLTSGDPTTPIVFFGRSVRDWAPYNAALRAEKLGFTAVYWYRGGLSSWSDAGGSMFPRGAAP